MKKVVVIIITIFLTSSVFCQTKIGIESINNHVGEKVTVCAKVYSTKTLEKVTFLDLGAAYPNSLLSVVIFANDRSNFKEAPDLIFAHKNICVTGTVKEYKGEPEIIVNSPNNIKLK